MSEAEDFEGDDFYWSDSDSSDVETEHDLQASIENKGMQNDDDNEESDEENEGEDSDSDEETNLVSGGMGKAFSEAFTKILSKETKQNAGPLSQYKAPIKKLEEEKLQHKVRSVINARKKQKLEKNHIPVDQFSTFEEERRLKNAARKGVVKLFNAVNKHQKILARELNGKEQHPDKVEQLSKDKFFEILQQSTSSKPQVMSREEKQMEVNAQKNIKGSTTSWSVFDDNYMLHNQKLRDWDKKTDEDQQMEQELEGEIEGIGFGDW